MTIKNLLFYLSLYDKQTYTHACRVACYANNLGKRLNLSNYEMNLLLYSSLLHDIGKSLISEELLYKKSKLNDNELKELQDHVIFGLALLPDSMQEVKEVIAAHHERLDGSGYPYKLEDEQIPKLSKILAIVDSYDAMTTNRGYNEVKTMDEAFDDLLSNTNYYGKNKYCYSLVKSFIDCTKK